MSRYLFVPRTCVPDYPQPSPPSSSGSTSSTSTSSATNTASTLPVSTDTRAKRIPTGEVLDPPLGSGSLTSSSTPSSASSTTTTASPFANFSFPAKLPSPISSRSSAALKSKATSTQKSSAKSPPPPSPTSSSSNNPFMLSWESHPTSGSSGAHTSPSRKLSPISAPSRPPIKSNLTVICPTSASTAPQKLSYSSVPNTIACPGSSSKPQEAPSSTSNPFSTFDSSTHLPSVPPNFSFSISSTTSCPSRSSSKTPQPRFSSDSSKVHIFTGTRNTTSDCTCTRQHTRHSFGPLSKSFKASVLSLANTYALPVPSIPPSDMPPTQPTQESPTKKAPENQRLVENTAESRDGRTQFEFRGFDIDTLVSFCVAMVDNPKFIEMTLNSLGVSKPLQCELMEKAAEKLKKQAQKKLQPSNAKLTPIRLSRTQIDQPSDHMDEELHRMLEARKRKQQRKQLSSVDVPFGSMCCMCSNSVSLFWFRDRASRLLCKRCVEVDEYIEAMKRIRLPKITAAQEADEAKRRPKKGGPETGDWRVWCNDPKVGLTGHGRVNYHELPSWMRTSPESSYAPGERYGRIEGANKEIGMYSYEYAPAKCIEVNEGAEDDRRKEEKADGNEHGVHGVPGGGSGVHPGDAETVDTEKGNGPPMLATATHAVGTSHALREMREKQIKESRLALQVFIETLQDSSRPNPRLGFGSRKADEQWMDNRRSTDEEPVTFEGEFYPDMGREDIGGRMKEKGEEKEEKQTPDVSKVEEKREDPNTDIFKDDGDDSRGSDASEPPKDGYHVNAIGPEIVGERVDCKHFGGGGSLVDESYESVGMKVLDPPGDRHSTEKAASGDLSPKVPARSAESSELPTSDSLTPGGDSRSTVKAPDGDPLPTRSTESESTSELGGMNEDSSGIEEGLDVDQELIRSLELVIERQREYVEKEQRLLANYTLALEALKPDQKKEYPIGVVVFPVVVVFALTALVYLVSIA